MCSRNSVVKTTTISRIISNIVNVRKSQNDLIKNSKKTEPEILYEIKDFDFNNKTRVAHINFLETTYYKKILRYVTQDYVKYPVYSDWISKNKIVKKTLKLTNENLENLKTDADPLIKQFSYEIVSKLNNPDLYPSWFIIDTLRTELKFKVDEIIEKFDQLNICEQNTINELNKLNREQSSKLSKAYGEISHLKDDSNELTNLICRAKKVSAKFYWLFTVLTLGLYAWFHSQKRICRLENEKINIDAQIKDKQCVTASIRKKIEELNTKIATHQTNISANNRDKETELLKIHSHYNELISAATPLPISLNDHSDEGFIPLKKLSGMQYEKIIGCYVIHNCENNKYYVGQSKDVMKRICKQHFDGTNIKNIIFAEDFYNSKLNNKDDLFEVKIIRLNTKDELDATEKMLIEEYDSFNNGYNGTNGNS